MKKQYRTIEDILKEFKTDEQGYALWNVSMDSNRENWIEFKLEDDDEESSKNSKK